MGTANPALLRLSKQLATTTENGQTQAEINLAVATVLVELVSMVTGTSTDPETPTEPTDHPTEDPAT